MSGLEGVNVPLLRKGVEWVEEQAALPEIARQWDQRHYLLTNGERAEWHRVGPLHSCGTTYCVAGKIAADADPRYATYAWVDDLHCSEYAAGLLGISVDDAEEEGGLFHADNTAADVRRIGEDLAGEQL